jgi:hypothetical protein
MDPNADPSGIHWEHYGAFCRWFADTLERDEGEDSNTLRLFLEDNPLCLIPLSSICGGLWMRTIRAAEPTHAK